MRNQQFVWVERFSQELHLPVWGGALVYSAVLAVAFPSIYFAAGAWNFFVSTDGYYVLAILPAVTFFFLLPTYIRKQMTSLEAHALSMVSDVEAVGSKLSLLTNFPVALTIRILFSSVISVPFIVARTNQLSLAASLATSFVPWTLALLVIGTALWTWAYSMVAIYRIGKLPMNLQPFTKDRTLGLGFFASTSMRLTAIYYLYISTQLIVDFSSLGFILTVLVRDTALIMFGLFLFLVPRISLRRKLLQARNQETDWIADRYTRVMKRVKSNPDASFDQTIQQELLSIDKIQKDVHSIRTWPFDTGILVRLAAIILSLVAILLSAVVRDLFHF